MQDPWKEMENGIRASGRRSGWLIGKASGCPFCLARGREKPLVGERIRVLFELPQYARGLIGMIGTVLETPDGEIQKLGQIFVKLDDDPFGPSFLSFDQVFVETLPRRSLPSWVPPIPMKQAGPLDMIVMRLCDESQ